MAYHTRNHLHNSDSPHHTQTNLTHPTAAPHTTSLRQTKPAARLQAQQGLRPWVAGLLSVALGVGPSLGLGTIGAFSTGDLSVLAQTGTGSTGTLTRWRFNSQTQVLEVILPAGATPRSFLLARPMRLVVDFPNSILPGVPPTQTYGGIVRRVTWSQYDATTARVVMELDSNVVLAPQQVDMQQMEGGRWSIRPVVANPEAFAEVAPTPIPATPVATAPDPIAPPNTPPTTPTPIDLPSTGLTPNASLLASPVTSPTVTSSSLNGASDLARVSESANDAVRQVLADRIAAFNGVEGVQPSETALSPLGNPGEAGSLIPIQGFGVDPNAVNPNTIDPTGVSSTAIDPTGVSSTAIESTGVDSTAIESTGVDPTGVDLTATLPLTTAPAATAPVTAADRSPTAQEIPVLPVLTPNRALTAPIAAPDRPIDLTVSPLAIETSPEIDRAASPLAIETSPAPDPTPTTPFGLTPSPQSLSTTAIDPSQVPASILTQDNTNAPATLPSIPLTPTIVPGPTSTPTALQPPAPQSRPATLPDRTLTFGQPFPGNTSTPMLASTTTQGVTIAPPRQTNPVQVPTLPLSTAPVPATTPLPSSVPFTLPNPASPSPTAPSSGLQTVPLTVVPSGPFDSPYRSTPAQTASTPKPNVLLPKDSEIKLRYTGSTPLVLDQDNMVQEVLIVEEDVIDSFNRLILPAGSQVIGRFEQGLRGTRFIAQAVALNKGNRSLVASSDPIRSDRQNLGRSISVGSGVGAAAGAVIGGGLGALGGAAAGAATGYLFTPSMQVIEPNQTVVIRLREDWE